jgi:FkbM family methyltransferase
MTLKSIVRRLMGLRLSQYARDTIYSYKVWRKRAGMNKAVRLQIQRHYELVMLKLKNAKERHVVQCNGYKLLTIPNDVGISKELIIFKSHEPVSTKLISKLLKKEMMCIDIGSNLGYYAILESMLCKQVYAIEPSPTNYQVLLDNVQLNGANNICTYDIAIGDINGYTQFIISDRSNWSRVAGDVDNTLSAEERTARINVPIMTLDSFIERHKLPRVDFIRLDVEGFEYNILLHANKTLARFRPLIMVEIHYRLLGRDKTKMLLEKLQTYGYEEVFYINHEIDISMVGTARDVRRIEMRDVNDILDQRIVPEAFHLIVKPPGF